MQWVACVYLQTHDDREDIQIERQALCDQELQFHAIVTRKNEFAQGVPEIRIEI